MEEDEDEGVSLLWHGEDQSKRISSDNTEVRDQGYKSFARQQRVGRERNNIHGTPSASTPNSHHLPRHLQVRNGQLALTAAPAPLPSRNTANKGFQDNFFTEVRSLPQLLEMVEELDRSIRRFAENISRTRVESEEVLGDEVLGDQAEVEGDAKVIEARICVCRCWGRVVWCSARRRSLGWFGLEVHVLKLLLKTVEFMALCHVAGGC